MHVGSDLITNVNAPSKRTVDMQEESLRPCVHNEKIAEASHVGLGSTAFHGISVTHEPVY